MGPGVTVSEQGQRHGWSGPDGMDSLSMCFFNMETVNIKFWC